MALAALNEELEELLDEFSSFENSLGNLEISHFPDFFHPKSDGENYGGLL